MAELDLGKIAQAKYYERISGAAEGTIGFGKAVMRGTNPEKQYKEFDGTTGAKIAGFAGFGLSGDIDDEQYVDEQPMVVVTQGVMVVPVYADADTAPTAGDKVAVAPDGTVFTAAEADSDSDSGGTYAVKLANAQFVEGAAAGDNVEIEIDFPMETEEVQLA